MERYLLLLLLVSSSISFLLVDEDLCTDVAEFLAHPNCSLYYQCSNGVPILQSCPQGYFFNLQLEICDYPSNVPECVGGTRPPVPTTTPIPQTTTNSTPVSMTTSPTTTPSITSPTTISTTTNSTSPTTPSPLIERKCGQVINETSGHIAYKLNEEYGNHERCAWTISVPGASKFRFVLQQSEFEPEPGVDGILVTGLSRNGNDTEIDTSYINQTSIIYEVTGNTAIVLFYSDSSISGLGFLLSFVVDVTEEPEYSENHIINTNFDEYVEFTRGQERNSTYANNELTTILHTAPLGGTLLSSYMAYLGEDCTKDYVLLLKLAVFYGEGPPFWVEAPRLCSATNGWIRNQNYDITLYVFKTDEIDIYPGFFLHLSSQSV